MGIVIALIAPIIGIFLVLKRYSLIADTLAHISFLGVALGLLLGFNPALTAIGTSVLASVGMEKLRNSKQVYGESILAIFLSGSLALAVVILSFFQGLSVNLFSYLFGSIVTVTMTDMITIIISGLVVLLVVLFFYRDFLYVTFNEDLAKIGGVNVNFVNTVLIALTSLVIALAIPVVGVLLISALVVIPVVTALQLRNNFLKTIFYAQFFSVFSVVSGIFASYYLSISTGGAIVLIMLFVFAGVFLLTKIK